MSAHRAHGLSFAHEPLEGSELRFARSLYFSRGIV